MAATGEATALYNDFRRWTVTLTGVTEGSQSQNFESRGHPASSFVVEGTMYTSSAPTLQWYGSNDGGTSWVAVGTSFTPTSATQTWGGSLTGSGMAFALYYLGVTGGDSGTSINAYLFFYPVDN